MSLSRDVDSLDAQVASYYVKQEHPEQWLDFDVALLEALWEDARDIGDVDVLADVAEDVGLDPKGDSVRRRGRGVARAPRSAVRRGERPASRACRRSRTTATPPAAPSCRHSSGGWSRERGVGG